MAEGFVILQLVFMFFLAVTPRGTYISLAHGVIEALKGKSDNKASKLAKAFKEVLTFEMDCTSNTAPRILIIVTASLRFMVLDYRRTASLRGTQPTVCPTWIFLFSPVVLRPPVRAAFIAAASLYISLHSLILIGKLVIIGVIINKTEPVKKVILYLFRPKI